MKFGNEFTRAMPLVMMNEVWKWIYQSWENMYFFGWRYAFSPDLLVLYCFTEQIVPFLNSGRPLPKKCNLVLLRHLKYWKECECKWYFFFIFFFWLGKRKNWIAFQWIKELVRDRDLEYMNTIGSGKLTWSLGLPKIKHNLAKAPRGRRTWRRMQKALEHSTEILKHGA